MVFEQVVYNLLGHWALGIGHWALGIGHWALGIEKLFPSPKLVPMFHTLFPIPYFYLTSAVAA
ncbi:MAG: hypothetical protein KME55_20615 [Nostoc indistinguendum CM1-VF10]|jgi:hypothetical protein|nr:hypothetical protein [Nostoc indistinguendum CM1-VF10]